MLHTMHLQPAPFEMIRSGRKTIELRLNDEKRQQVQVGDFIEFSLLGRPDQKLQTRVTALHHYASFRELFAAVPKEKLGYMPQDTPDPESMDAFYAAEEQEKYGVLGIELRCTELQRFLKAQDSSFGGYQTALAEMNGGRKWSHWIWYIFPQLRGLGRSGTSDFYGIRDMAEAQDYLAHPVLGARLLEITEIVLRIPSDDPKLVFGRPDDLKVRSCMTLFHYAAPEQTLFRQVLDKFYDGRKDHRTARMLGIVPAGDEH